MVLRPSCNVVFVDQAIPHEQVFPIRHPWDNALSKLLETAAPVLEY